MKIGLNYVVRSGRYYHFRYTVPQDVRPFIGRTEIKKSLKTDSWLLAVGRAEQMSSRTSTLVRSIRRYMGTTKDKPNRDELIREIVLRAFHDGLKTDELERQGRGPRTEESMAIEMDLTEGFLNSQKSSLARNNLCCIQDDVIHYLTRYGYREEFSDPADMAKLCRERLKSGILQLQIMLKRAKGDYDNDYDNVTVDNLLALGLPTPVPTPDTDRPQVPAAAGITLAEATDRYVDEQMTAKVWLEKTRIESKAVLELLKEHFGNVPLSHLNHQRLLHFRDDVLRRIPAHRDRNPKYRDVKLADLLTFDIPECDRMSVDTQNKYLRRIGGLCGWAVRHEHLSASPASGLQYKKTKRPDEERAVYSPENLLNLQAALVQLPEHCHPWKYWSPLLAVYTGMRQNEIAQLHLDDIVDKNEVPCFDVNGRGEDKRLKSKAARRLVPMHPHLVDLGFLDYIEELRRQGEERVWPDLQKNRDGYGKPISRWFARWRKTWLTPEDLQQHKKDFHSFRHTFDDRLKQAGVLDVRLPQLMGHSMEADQTFGRYGDLLRPPQLLEAVKLLDLGFDLDKLRREWK